MPFPYMYPIGALVAGVILGAMLTLFAVTLRAMDRAITRVGDSILSGLVTGFRGWSSARQAARRISSGSDDREESVSPVPAEHVQRS